MSAQYRKNIKKFFTTTSLSAQAASEETIHDTAAPPISENAEFAVSNETNIDIAKILERIDTADLIKISELAIMKN